MLGVHWLCWAGRACGFIGERHNCLCFRKGHWLVQVGAETEEVAAAIGHDNNGKACTGTLGKDRGAYCQVQEKSGKWPGSSS